MRGDVTSRVPSFSSFVRELTEGKNTHMTHIEDLVLIDGVDGARQAINFLRGVRDTLAGHAHNKHDITVKWDGCLHENTMVLTNRGEMSIRQLVETWSANDTILIRGNDGEHDRWVLVKDVFGTTSDKRWVEIACEDHIIVVTEDHQMMTTNRGWVAAGDLVEGDDLKEMES